jgi:hypothetical protein
MLADAPNCSRTHASGSAPADASGEPNDAASSADVDAEAAAALQEAPLVGRIIRRRRPGDQQPDRLRGD